MTAGPLAALGWGGAIGTLAGSSGSASRSPRCRCCSALAGHWPEIPALALAALVAAWFGTGLLARIIAVLLAAIGALLLAEAVPGGWGERRGEAAIERGAPVMAAALPIRRYRPSPRHGGIGAGAERERGHSRVP